LAEGGSGQRAIHLNGVQPKMAWKSSVSAAPPIAPIRELARCGKILEGNASFGLPDVRLARWGLISSLRP
jgi:hypothetical protein